MPFVLKITGQNGEPYAAIEGLSPADAELLAALARTVARTTGSSWPVPVCHCARCEARRRAEPSPGPCCDLHNVNCEQPSELCCQRCTEAGHPHHPPGVPCVIAPEMHPTRRDLDRMEGP